MTTSPEVEKRARLEAQKLAIEEVLAATGLDVDRLADAVHLKKETLRKYAGGYQPASERIMAAIRSLAAAGAHTSLAAEANPESAAKSGATKYSSGDAEDHAHEGVTYQTAEEGARGALKAARIEAGMSRVELARLLGISTALLQNLEESRAHLSERLAARICEYLPLDKDVLLGGSEAPRLHDETGMSGTFGATPNIGLPSGMTARYVPILSYTQAGAMTEWTDDLYQHEGVIAFDLPKRARAFALPVRGDSMEPQINAGDSVIIQWGEEPHNGEVVVACLGNGEVMCKIYQTYDHGQRVVLSSYNPRHEPIPLERDEIRWIFPVIGLNRKFRRH